MQILAHCIVLSLTAEIVATSKDLFINKNIKAKAEEALMVPL